MADCLQSKLKVRFDCNLAARPMKSSYSRSHRTLDSSALTMCGARLWAASDTLIFNRAATGIHLSLGHGDLALVIHLDGGTNNLQVNIVFFCCQERRLAWQ